MDDCLILGGGVIGLSLAYELARQGRRVRVVDRGAPGQEASWAGAGILPPATRRAEDHPYDQLAGLSHVLHAEWAARLREETGIDNGFRRTGGVHVARSAVAAAALRTAVDEWHARQIAAECLDPATLGEIEPALATRPPIQAACLLPDEAQIRNPWHLRALLAACARRGVTVSDGIAAEEFETRAGRIEGVRTVTGTLRAACYCVASGAWSQGLLARLGVTLAVRPIRGQMVLLNSPRPLLRRIVNEGPRYLVPRADGRILIGSTEEQAGFDKRTTASGVEGLLQFALGLAPSLAKAQVERTWAGLRPGTADGLPYLGPVPGWDNLFLAAGHFRSGLHLSCATAVVLAQVIRGQPPETDLGPFRCDRG